MLRRACHAALAAAAFALGVLLGVIFPAGLLVFILAAHIVFIAYLLLR